MDEKDIQLKVDEILAEARTWIGTRFVWGVAKKGKGVDCARFVYSVFKNVDLIKTGDLPPVIPKDWIHSKAEKIQRDFFTKQILRYGFEAVEYEDRRPGDIHSFHYKGVESHVAIIEDRDNIIHAVTDHEVRRESIRRWRNITGTYRWKDFI